MFSLSVRQEHLLVRSSHYRHKMIKQSKRLCFINFSSVEASILTGDSGFKCYFSNLRVISENIFNQDLEEVIQQSLAKPRSPIWHFQKHKFQKEINTLQEIKNKKKKLFVFWKIRHNWNCFYIANLISFPSVSTMLYEMLHSLVPIQSCFEIVAF